MAAKDKAPPVHAVVEHHPGCPPDRPHGITGTGGRLLACHATKQEAQDLALHLDVSDATAAPGWDTADSPTVSPAAAMMDIGATRIAAALFRAETLRIFAEQTARANRGGGRPLTAACCRAAL